MNKLKTIIVAVCSLVLVNTGTAIADSANFAGPYVGVSVSGYGMAMEGISSTTSGGVTETDEVPLGATTPVAGVELGYAIPLGSAFLIDIGGQFLEGEGELAHIGDDSDTLRNVTFKISDLMTGYIAPTLVLSDTSSLYIKAAVTEASVSVTGDVNNPGDLDGETWAIGTRTVLDSGIFIRTEAGYTNFSSLKTKGKGTTIATTSTYTADPTIAYGSVSLGFRF